MEVFIRLTTLDTPEINRALVGQILQRAKTIVELGMEVTPDVDTFTHKIEVSAVPLR